MKNQKIYLKNLALFIIICYMNIMIVFLSLILCLHAGPKLQPDHTSLDKPEDVSESVSKVVSKFDADFTEKEGSENIIYLDEKKYSLSEIMYDHNDELRQKMMNRFDHIKQYSEMAELLSSELLQKVRGIFEAQGHKDFDENIVQALTYSKFMSKGYITDKDITHIYFDGKYHHLEFAIQNEVFRNSVIEEYEKFELHMQENSELHKLYLRQFFTLKEYFNEKEYSDFDEKFFRAIAYSKALKLDTKDLFNKRLTEVDEIIQKTMIPEEDIKKLLGTVTLHCKKNNLVYLFIRKNRLKNPMPLADQVTHLVFTMDFQKVKDLIFTSSSTSELESAINLDKFFEHFSADPTLQGSMINIEMMKLVDGEPNALNLRDRSFIPANEIFEKVQMTEKDRQALLRSGYLNKRQVDSNSFYSFFSKDIIKDLIQLPKEATDIVFQMDYQKAIDCGLLLPVDKDIHIVNLRKFVQHHNDAEFQKIVSVQIIDQRPCISDLLHMDLTPVEDVLELVNMEDNGHYRTKLINSKMHSKKGSNSFWFCVREDLMRLPDYATHVSIMINCQKAMDLDLVEVIDESKSECAHDLNLRKFAEAYRTLQSGLWIYMMNIVHDDVSDRHKLSCVDNSVSFIKNRIFNKVITPAHDILNQTSISQELTERLLVDNIVTNRDGNVIYIFISKAEMKKYMSLPPNVTHVMLHIMDFNQAQQLRVVQNLNSELYFDLEKFIEVYFRDVRFRIRTSIKLMQFDDQHRVLNLSNIDFKSQKDIFSQTNMSEKSRKRLHNKDSYVKVCSNTTFIIWLRNKIEKLVQLPTGATHVALAMDTQQAKHLQVVELLNSNWKANLMKFIQSYSTNDEFKDKTEIYAMKFVHDESSTTEGNAKEGGTALPKSGKSDGSGTNIKESENYEFGSLEPTKPDSSRSRRKQKDLTLFEVKAETGSLSDRDLDFADDILGATEGNAKEGGTALTKPAKSDESSMNIQESDDYEFGSLEPTEPDLSRSSRK